MTHFLGAVEAGFTILDPLPATMNFFRRRPGVGLGDRYPAFRRDAFAFGIGG